LKVLKIIAGWTLSTLLLLQFIKIEVRPPPKATKADEIKAPPKIMALLKRSCYDCHSNETKYPWYGYVAPISWQVNSNIKNGRNWLNFSIWNRYSKEKQQKRFEEIVDALKIKMPPAEYLWIHKEARLSKKERKMLQEWAKSNIKKQNED
jgi:hypothetical protein